MVWQAPARLLFCSFANKGWIRFMLTVLRGG